MKYLVIIASGLTDQPCAEKDNKTPLELSETPNLDRTAQTGSTGSFQSIPDALSPGSDVSLLSLLGYDPEKYHQGPAHYDVAALGVKLNDGEIPLCLDFVNLQSSHNDMVMKDFTADHLSSENAKSLLDALAEQIVDVPVRFYPGQGHHHLMVIESPPVTEVLHPPHELVGEGIRQFMPATDNSKELVYLMNQAQIILHNHPYNHARKNQGLDSVNSIWLWGNGPGRSLPSFEERFGKKGAVITAATQFKGMARLAGMRVLEVSGATGFSDTDYSGKVMAALEALHADEVVYLHIGAPEEISLKGSLDDKILAIEDFDNEVLEPLLNGVKKLGDVKILLAVNHLCSVVKMKYGRDAVPYLAFPTRSNNGSANQFNEQILARSQDRFPSGSALVQAFFEDRL